MSTPEESAVMLDILNGSPLARNRRLREQIRARRDYAALSLREKLRTPAPPGWRWVSFGARWS